MSMIEEVRFRMVHRKQSILRAILFNKNIF